MINKIIKENNITTHKQLQRYLGKISNDRYYYDYSENLKEGLEQANLLDKCVLIELEGVKRYYENEKV